MIALGTLGLRLVPGFFVSGVPLSWADALFMATSAVCVTGLIVVDTATHFTLWGQAFLLLLIQAGGLGMVTIATLVLLQLGRRPSLRSEAVVPHLPRSAPQVETRRLIRDIVGFTFLLEGIGAAVLFLTFRQHFPLPEALWHAVFHAVSAFCNAGFSTFSSSLEPWATHSAVLWPVAVLIVLGGIGFLTLEELDARRRTRRGEDRFRLSLHTRIVLWATGLLIVAGALGHGFLEWDGVLAPFPLLARVENAVFMSITARTAGFNTIAYAEASDASNVLTMLLMFIGGSPGSTAGGLKTTTIVVIGLLAWSRIRGRVTVSAWARTIPDETVQRAVGVFVVATAVMAMGLFGFTIMESGSTHEDPFLWVLFETVSAFNTVGLSLGETGLLEPGSRVLASVLMFIGRIGPVAFAASLALKASGVTHRYMYAREDVSIG
jgi:trk system potassium uptake protein